MATFGLVTTLENAVKIIVFVLFCGFQYYYYMRKSTNSRKKIARMAPTFKYNPRFDETFS